MGRMPHGGRNFAAGGFRGHHWARGYGAGGYGGDNWSGDDYYDPVGPAVALGVMGLAAGAMASSYHHCYHRYVNGRRVC